LLISIEAPNQTHETKFTTNLQNVNIFVICTSYKVAPATIILSIQPANPGYQNANNAIFRGTISSSLSFPFDFMLEFSRNSQIHPALFYHPKETNALEIRPVTCRPKGKYIENAIMRPT
jgi:hypothetical protein